MIEHLKRSLVLEGHRGHPPTPPWPFDDDEEEDDEECLSATLTAGTLAEVLV